MPSDGLDWSGKFMGGIRADIKRKIPNYFTDFKDGLHSKVVGTTLFLFFAALANAIAFGALTGIQTGNQIGVVEMLIVTAIGGVVFALFSGQPLTILGGTGPITIFTGILYKVCNDMGIEFLSTYAWVGLWSGAILIIFALTDVSALMKYFTRFTDDIFAALISVIFIYEAFHDIIKSFAADGSALTIGFLTLILAIGTFLLTKAFKKVMNTTLFGKKVRQILSDFGPVLAIIIMTLVASQFGSVALAKPEVPTELVTTSGRPWLVNLFAVPTWVIFASIIPAIMATILLFLDQNITTRIVNASENRLKKGGGYHLDLGIVGIIILVASFFALPWIVAATVHSVNHVKSLADTKKINQGGVLKEVIVSVRENRLSGLIIHILIATSLFFLGLLQYIPMPVLFGIFLYMGFASLNGNQFYERISLWYTDPTQYPVNDYTKVVPKKSIHRFTIIQLACFIVLWVLKTSKIGILFPLMIAALVPIRLFASRFFKKEHIDVLLKEEHEVEE